MPATIALVGSGVVGERIAKRLEVVAPKAVVMTLDTRDHPGVPECDVAILAHPGPHAPLAAQLLAAGIDVVSVGDTIDDVRAMLDLHDTAASRDSTIVVGAGMSPGLTGLLARLLVERTSGCDEIHLFGSLCEGTIHPESDIDLAVRGFPKRKFFQTTAKLRRALEHPVDLVDLDCDNPFVHHLETSGRLVRLA